MSHASTGASSASDLPGVSGERRVYPRPWDYTGYLLTLLREAIADSVRSEVVRVGSLRVVDFGCGDRPYEKILVELGCTYIGVDIEGNPLADIRYRPEDPTALRGLEADVLLSTQVLEHVVDVPGYLAQCASMLRPGGLLILTTHGMWTYHPYPQDVRRWTRWGLVHDIERGGFRVESVTSCMGPLAYTTQLRLQLLRGALWKLRMPGRWASAVLSLLAQPLMRLEDALTPEDVRSTNAAIYVVSARR